MTTIDSEAIDAEDANIKRNKRLVNMLGGIMPLISFDTKKHKSKMMDGRVGA